MLYRCHLLILSSQPSPEVETNIPGLQMRKLRHRKVGDLKSTSLRARILTQTPAAPVRSIDRQRGPHVVNALYLHKTPWQSVDRCILALLVVSKAIAALSTGSHSDPHGTIFLFFVFKLLVV